MKTCMTSVSFRCDQLDLRALCFYAAVLLSLRKKDEDFVAQNAKVHVGENEDLEVVPLMDSEACLALACFLAAAHSPIG